MHVSLDGYVAGPAGEMDWIKLGDEMWEYVESITANADAAIYGEHTFKMMESYWPTAALKPDATRHDINHAAWANAVQKIIFSNTITHSDWEGTEFLKGDPFEEMLERKAETGKNMLMIGSPTLAQEFMRLGLIDEYRLNVNPIILGSGKRLFAENEFTITLELIESKAFSTGVQALHYNLLKK
jgi:dihydrofolate reductase